MHVSGSAADGPRILTVDDDRGVLYALRYALQGAGFEVAGAASALEAKSWIERHGLPHLAVVDIRMPGMSGLELCDEIHRYCDLPIIMLTAVDDEPIMVQALDRVAEDYVVKPLRPAELVARVRRVLSRVADFSYARKPNTRVDDELSIDFVRQRAWLAGRETSLTPTESKILYILVSNAGRTVSTEHLLRRIWPLEEVLHDALRVHVHRLRQKIEPDAERPSYVVTVRGLGYRFRPALGRAPTLAVAHPAPGRSSPHEAGGGSGKKLRLTPAQPAASRLDPARQNLLRQLSPLALAEIAGAFLDGAPQRMEDLRGALKRRDWAEMEQAAHAITGSSRNLGAKRLGDLAVSLERLARGRDLARVRETVPEILTEYERVVAELKGSLG